MNLEKRDSDLVKRLAHELHIARKAIIDIAPEKARGILSREPATREELRAWLPDAAAKIIELATPTVASWGQDLAICPLCGDGVMRHHASGFSFPEGLRRHLVGHGRMQRCTVLDAAWALAQERFPYAPPRRPD